MKAITTKFHGPSNVRGSRYSATDSDGNKVIIGADDSLSFEGNHDAAAVALCNKMNWHGVLVSGTIVGTGNVYVWLSGDSATVADNVIRIAKDGSVIQPIKAA